MKDSARGGARAAAAGLAWPLANATTRSSTKSERVSDVVLDLEGAGGEALALPAHRVVLVAASTYFFLGPRGRPLRPVPGGGSATGGAMPG